MNRRRFLKNTGLSTAGAVVAAHHSQAKPPQERLPEYPYPFPKSLQALQNSEGHIAIRWALRAREGYRPLPVSGRLRLRKGKPDRIKTLFWEGGKWQHQRQTFEVVLTPERVAVFAVWLSDFSPETELRLEMENGEAYRATLAELLQDREKAFESEQLVIKCNPLPYAEVGELDPAAVNIPAQGEKFCFAAFADPQGGLANDADYLNTRMKVHNAFIEESVQLLNQLELKPAFNIVIGDICDEQGEEKDLLNMNHFLGKLEAPTLYTIGNHETRYRCEFEPGYRMQDFSHYFAAQKAFNGMEKLLYSFNLGGWHFVAWPDPLRSNFWETHPHYFDWLERDLSKHRERPTVIFQHVPIHPIGICPLINYAEQVNVKKQLLDILSKHGNVKLVLSGHVHIPVKASFKTAVEHRGIRFINLPAAGYRPRGFGEADFYGGPTQGFAIVELVGKNAQVTFKTVTEEEYPYPQKLRQFDAEAYPLWYGHKWELPAQTNLVNGTFEQGLKGWGRRWVYREDANPSNRCEVHQNFEGSSTSSLYLYTRCRGYHAPGQDRLPQWNNQIFQAVKVQPTRRPALDFSYRLDEKTTDLDGLNGGLVCVEGFNGTVKMFNLTYSLHHYWNEVGGKSELFREVPPILFDLPTNGQRTSVTLNLATDFETQDEQRRTYESLSIDRLVVNLGVWHLNDGADHPFAVYFDGFSLGKDMGKPSQSAGQPISRKPEALIWWRGKYHPNGRLAGEHHYHWEMPLRFGKQS